MWMSVRSEGVAARAVPLARDTVRTIGREKGVRCGQGGAPLVARSEGTSTSVGLAGTDSRLPETPKYSHAWIWKSDEVFSLQAR